MYARLLCVCLAAVSVVADVIEDCKLSGDKTSSTEQALLSRLAPLKHKRFETTYNDGKDSYTYTFVVCGHVFNSSTSTNEGLVQNDTKASKTTVIGRIDETHIINGTDWILLIYKNGEKYDSHCGSEPRKAMIMISCNKNTLADGFTIISEEKDKNKECFYLFEMDSSVACPIEESHLSVGSILLIVFAVLVGLYIIGGFLYQRFVVGAKGMDQFPNITFWRELGNLVADGCDFVCRSQPRSSETAYRGVGDDHLGEEPEERDDHLLPM
ncbi:cation-dependent mannose-6-phosphate receptor [Hyla sarda]|uniref:cation-dependent mannose-6-phosphate receptor n=1 Tax=Hyla sarda TaxID=327740 RepID=UPI0024C23094|nr:cation-dependent mannose-6-phosphate receptor [Hyla sarda]XP_056385136.1 cation-dependent mannose-6-phosphate receptor [Hyla sarda]XP_056385137.1 cation-dependent mannose-6-phosphate receptor [Hyla sarda]